MDPAPHPHTFVRRSRIALRQAERRLGAVGGFLRTPENTVTLAVAAVIGILAGLGAVVLRALIIAFQKAGYGLASPTVAYLASLPWYLKLLIPTVGGLGVGFIVRYFAPEAKGHGVPEVMEAVAVKGGMIRKRVSVAKAVASALSIASGGSTGREGPIIQIGAAIGSTLGRYVGLNPQRVKVYVACGAAAGIAAAFNAPLAGAIFAAEIILADFGVPRLGPVVVAAVAATAMSRSLLGDQRAFVVPTYDLRSAWEFIPYTLLGLLSGVTGAAFIKVLYWIEDRFDGSPIPRVLRPATGGLLVGAISLGVPQILGIGYEGITKAVTGQGVWYVLLGLALAKLVATSITLGSGGSGGIFAPSLFLGATVGGALGQVVHSLFPDLTASHGAYALVGMGGLVAATTHAPITAILILFEMTGSYKIMLPLMFTVVGAVLVSSRLNRESIYTEKLTRRGLNVRAGREMNVLRAQKVSEVMTEASEVFQLNSPLSSLVSRAVESPRTQFFVKDDQDKLVGVIHAGEVRRVLFDQSLTDLIIAADLVEPLSFYLYPEDTLDQAMRLFGETASEEIAVVERGDPAKLLGVISRGDCIDAYNRAISRLDAAGEIAYGSRLLGRTREITVSEGFHLVELEAPSAFHGKDLKSLELPARHGVQVLLVRRSMGNREEFQTVPPRADLVLKPADRLILAGSPEAVSRFRSL